MAVINASLYNQFTSEIADQDTINGTEKNLLFGRDRIYTGGVNNFVNGYYKLLFNRCI